MTIPSRGLLSAHMPLRRGEAHDYPWREVILSFLPVAEEFVLLVEETDTDGTLAAAREFAAEHRQVKLIVRDWWNLARKESALADATDQCIEACSGVYHVAVQADEVLHENQQASLRGIAENGSFLWTSFERLNFFGTFDLVNVNRKRWPCEVVRMARRDLYPQVRSHGDATHLGWVRDFDPERHQWLDARGCVQLFHYAYARNPGAYLERQLQMSRLYGWGEDPRLTACRERGVVNWFDIVPKSEFLPVPGPHPAVMTEWIEARRAAVESGAL